MNKDKIIQIINSDRSDEFKTQRLLYFYNRNPNLFDDIRFDDGRTIFHHLFSINSTKILEKLLSVKSLKNLALKTDNNGQTILHYAVEKPELLPRLIGYLPEIINLPDNHGNTPLHLAVIGANLSATWHFVRNLQTNRSLRNGQDKTPMDLTQDKEILGALLHVDLTQIKLPDIYTSPRLNERSIERLQTVYPLLSSRKQECLPGSSSDDGSIRILTTQTPAVTSSGSKSPRQPVISSDWLERIKTDLDDPKVSKNLLQELIDISLSAPPSTETQERIKLLCQHIDLSQIPSIEQFITSNPGYQAIIRDILNDLFPIIESQHKTLQSEQRELTKQFTSLLIRNGFLSEISPISTPDFTLIYPENIPLIKTLWSLTSGQVSYELVITECDLVWMSNNPETMTVEERKNVLRKNAAYVLFESQLFYINEKFTCTKLDVSDPSKLQSIFPNELDKIVKSEPDKLLEITALTGHSFSMTPRAELDPGKLYLKPRETAISYSVMTPQGAEINDVLLTEFEAPIPFTLSQLQPLELPILERAFLNNHVPAIQRTNDLDKVMFRAISLLQGSYSYTQILIGLRLLYPHFDYHQKLTANFIVWQLMLINSEHLITKSSDEFQFKLFKQCHVNSRVGLDALGAQINQLFETWNACYARTVNPLLLSNVRLLSNWLEHRNFNGLRLSIKSLFELAISKPENERSEEVTLIVTALINYTRSFFRHLSLKELQVEGWSNPNIAPNIVSFTKFFNQFNIFLITLIIGKPFDQAVSVLKLLVQIMQELCPLSGGNQPDLQSLMLISSVLNDIKISRLHRYFDVLTPKEKGIIEEVNRLVDSKQNYKNMRELRQTFIESLPFLGITQAELTFAKVGNWHLVSRAEAIGEVLLSILKIKSQVNCLPIRTRTDLTEFITSLPGIDEEELYLGSQRMQPPIYVLPRGNCDIASTLQTLNNDYLFKKILPKVKYQDTAYSEGHLSIKLLDWFSEKIPKSTCSAGQMTKLQEAFASLKQTINTVIEVNSNYEHREFSQKITPAYFSLKLNQLERKISSLTVLDPDSTQAASSTPTGRPRSSSFFLRRRDSTTHATQDFLGQGHQF
jgi:hypothetical protein